MMKKVATLFFALLPFALSSFNANAEDSPQQDEAFDYIKDRQFKVSHLHKLRCDSTMLNQDWHCTHLAAVFNTIDPKADQYPELNPYLYCAGNPIKYIDPTGKVIAIEDGDKTYTFGEIDGNYGFYCDGQLLTGNDFADKTTKAICEIMKGGIFGNILVNTISEDDKVVTIRKGMNCVDDINTCDLIYWDAKKQSKGGLDITDNVIRPGYIGLAHEFAHILSYLLENPNRTDIWLQTENEKIFHDEIFSCFWENLIRREHKIPLRKYYTYMEYYNTNTGKRCYEGIEQSELFSQFLHEFFSPLIQQYEQK